MNRFFCFPLFACVAAGLLAAAPADDDAVFRTDVSLVRVDVQVLDRENRAITGLRADDFVLREEGKAQQIRNFARENMPVDVLLLFDVSASMRPHVERIASAAHQAMQVLGDNDRVGIMVFDRSTRVRLPFRGNRNDVERELENMLRQENFHGGTDITRGLLDAADYVARNGRRDARRAIVILTDDQTERDRDEERVGRALEKANAVLMALIAPDAMANGTYSPGGGRRGGGSYPSGGGSGGGMGGGWPGGGGGLGGPLGGIILGRRGGYGGRGGSGGPGGGYGAHTKSAGTAEIARQSGGDSVPVDDAAALETTLDRIRQRYALHFHAAEGAQSGQERRLEVALSDTARRRYPDAEVRYRQVYMSSSDAGNVTAGPTMVTRSQSSTTSGRTSEPVAAPDADRPVFKRRPISEPDGRGTSPSVGESNPEPAQTQPSDQSARPGWRKAKPGEQP